MDLALSTYIPKTKPYRHQEIALEQGWDRRWFGWLMEMGTGKSKIAIDNIFMLREAKKIDCVLIIAPRGTYANWIEKEFPAHAPDLHLETSVLHLWRGGHTSAEKAQLKKILNPKGDLFRIFVMNTEAVVASTVGSKLVKDFVRTGRCLVIVDESSTIKNPKALRTKKMIAIGRLAAYRRIATGTPVTQSPLDLWSQFEFLNPRCLGFSSFTAFRAHFAILRDEYINGTWVRIVVGHRRTEELAQLISQHSIIARKEDCLELPPKVYDKRFVSLTPEQSRVYGDLKRWMTSEIESGQFVSATQAVTCLLRLHQVVCGHVVDESGKVHDLPSNRIQVLLDVLDEIQDKTIVWCNYRRDVGLVMEALAKSGRKAVRYDGSTNVDDRTDAIEQFQTGNADVFVGTPHAGGYGITLTMARAVVYYSNTYDLEKRLQSEDRAHRIGQGRSVTYIDLVARDTVDEQIAKALQRKEDLAAIITKGPARLKDFV